MALLLLILCLSFLTSGPSPTYQQEFYDYDQIDLNECNIIEWHSENVSRLHSRTVKETYYTGFCLTLKSWFQCKKERSKIVWEVKSEMIQVPKLTKVCCDGFEKLSGKCMPICGGGCFNGECVEPNECLCHAGFQGARCDQECDDTRYGRNCEEFCACQNFGTCDKKNGSCLCPPGFTGLYCESKCPKDSFGDNCENQCHCKNGATCEITQGSCLCPPGYIGKFCEEICPDFEYGINCGNNCNCEKNNTEFCSHIDGNCSCYPGYIGTACQEKCSSNFWGPRCENECDCGNHTCSHISGECDCLPGFHGAHCSKTCDKHTFGKDCLESCQCFNNATCTPDNGECLCNPGWMGENCIMPCPEGMYGYYCNFLCTCENNNSKCDSVTGKCLCASGWTGEFCEEATENSEMKGGIFEVVILSIVIGSLAISICCYIAIKIKKRYCSRTPLENETNVVSDDDAMNASSGYTVHDFTNPIYQGFDRRVSSINATITNFLRLPKCRSDGGAENNTQIVETDSTAPKEIHTTMEFVNPVAIMDEETNRVRYSKTKSELERMEDNTSLYHVSVCDEKEGASRETHIYEEMKNVLDGDELENTTDSNLSPTYDTVKISRRKI